jgi:hypothetical protein
VRKQEGLPGRPPFFQGGSTGSKPVGGTKHQRPLSLRLCPVGVEIDNSGHMEATGARPSLPFEYRFSGLTGGPWISVTVQELPAIVLAAIDASDPKGQFA